MFDGMSVGDIEAIASDKNDRRCRAARTRLEQLHLLDDQPVHEEAELVAV